MADEEPKQEVEQETKVKVTRKPDKQVFERTVNGINAEIEKLKKQMERIQEQADQHRGKKGAKGPVAEARQVMKTIRDEKNVIMDERKRLFDARDAFKAGMEQMKAQAQQMKGGMKFSNLDDINKALIQLERTHSTTSMTLNQEKDLIKEIETLKGMKKLVAGFSATKDKMASGKEQSKDLGEKIREQNELLAGVNKKMDEQKAVLDKLNEKEGNKKDMFPQLMKEKDGVKKLVDDQYNQLRELRTKWRDDNNEWFEYSKVLRAQKQVEWEAEQAKRQEEWEAKQAELEAEELKKEPWEAEKALCDFLVDYLTRISGGDKVVEETKKEETKHLEGFTAYSKKDAEQEDFLMFGGGGKKKGKKGGNKKKKAAVIKHDIDTIQTFAAVSLRPPTSADDIASSLEEVKAKKAWYYEQPRPDPKAKKAEAEAAAAPSKPKKSNKKQSLPSDSDFPDLGGGAAPKKAAAAPAAPAASAPAAAPAAAAASSGGFKAYHGNEIPEDKMTFSDDGIIGTKLPDLEGLDWLQQGDEAKAAIKTGKPMVIVFWGKYAKGDYKLLCHFSDLNDRSPDATFIGIACDAEKEDAEKLFTKIGKAMPEQGIDSFTLNFPSAYDPGKKVNSAFKRNAMLSSIGPGFCMIIDRMGTVVWKEQFTSSWFLAQGQFEEQLRRYVEGEKLLNNGPRPEGEGDDEEEISVEVGGDEFDAFADDDGTGDY